MEFRSVYRFAPIAPRKARLVMDLIRGKPVNDALEILRFTPKRAAYMIDKTLRAALASAEEGAEVDLDSLKISEARIDGGPTRKWHWARPRGMSAPLRRRTSHITVVLSNEEKPKG